MKECFVRYSGNPLFSPGDLAPSDSRLAIRGVFNPGAVEFGGKIYLLLRVAENAEPAPGRLAVPVVTAAGLTLRDYALTDPELDLSDSRYVRYRGELLLSTLSHLRLAESDDGVHFKVRSEPFLYPTLDYEAFGIEDARLTVIDDEVLINYTAVGPDGFCTALARTRDFVSVERLGIMLPPENKDVCIFPEKINGRYHCLHRPLNTLFGRHSIWYASAANLSDWGGHRCVLRGRDNEYEMGRVGGGAPCIRTDSGWLQIYHAADREHRYQLFAALFDLSEPWKLLARSSRPIFSPLAAYEAEGFFGQVVFTNGVVLRGDELLLYYGAADEHTCLAKGSLPTVLAALDERCD